MISPPPLPSLNPCFHFYIPALPPSLSSIPIRPNTPLPGFCIRWVSRGPRSRGAGHATLTVRSPLTVAVSCWGRAPRAPPHPPPPRCYPRAAPARPPGSSVSGTRSSFWNMSNFETTNIATVIETYKTWRKKMHHEWYILHINITSWIRNQNWSRKFRRDMKN